jgi:hypothetical protein
MAKRDKRQLGNRIATFVRQYARKAYPTHDPNDRSYDREIEKIIKKMSPVELDRLMREDEDDESV